ncbi:MAG: alanine racemase [Saprospiraceae bacterium]|nr:alanine racemase [Saprospiraceae bacterium]
MRPTSYIELSESALEANISFIKNMLGDTRLSSVVKGNAYGHGIPIFCSMLYKTGVRHFSVFSANEAQEILASIPNDISVMVMGFLDDDQIEWAIQKEVEFFLFEEERLEKAIELSKKAGKAARVHIELETGMNRTGFDLKNLKKLFQYLEENKTHLHISGVCSHLAGAESIANYKRLVQQYDRFKRVKNHLSQLDWLDTTYHLACSAASIQYPKTRMDLARIGILQYGFFPSNEVLVQYLTKHKTQENPLKRVISWKTRVMAVKEVKAGEFIGYGTSFFTNIKTKVAVLPVGYAQGFARSLSNQGKVLIRGKRFDVVGTVNMNMTIVDITECDTIEVGEEVILIGKQGDLEISVSSFSNFSDMVNYELLTRLPENITRTVVK